jgi:hypothetical protein
MLGKYPVTPQPITRISVVPWSYHRDVAKLTEPQQKRALAWAAKNLDEKGPKGAFEPTLPRILVY